jgi:hypothetical protein
MVKYDADVLQKHAGKLYSRANTIILTATVFGVLIGAASGFFLENVVQSGSAPVVIGACGLILGAVGYSFGSARAFALKLMAQQALCQVQIEMNTRRS